MRRARMAGGVLLAALGCGVGWGQTEALHANGPLPSFEVATIKPTDPDPRHAVRVYPAGVSAQTRLGGSVKMMIAMAYRVSVAPGYFGVVNAPAWTEKTRYMVDVKIPDEIFAKMQKMTLRERWDEQELMMQSLLAERFKLKVHFERREQPVYELVAAKGGVKLPPPLDQTPAAMQANGMPPASLSAGGGGNPRTGIFTRANMSLEEMFHFTCCGLDGRPIVNKTGLTGNYTVQLKLAPGDPDAKGEIMDPAIFAAAEEQLGLKLVPGKAMVEVVVVDHIELPTEN